jgi:hypothetical protein
MTGREEGEVKSSICQAKPPPFPNPKKRRKYRELAWTKYSLSVLRMIERPEGGGSYDKRRSALQINEEQINMLQYTSTTPI